MRTVSGKEFAKILERHGWNLLRIEGSHHIYGKSGNIARHSVPIHRNQALRMGLLKHPMKLAELSENDLS